MKQCKHLSLVGIIAILLLGISLPAFSVTASNKAVFVDEAKFGIMYKGADDKWQFKETDRIPNKVGTPYRWYIHLRTDKNKVTWKEEFILPAPAVVWGGEEKKEFQVSSDRKVSIKEMTVSPKDGWISHGWSVAEGDPSGKYVMKIYVEGQFVKEFVFFVE
jgi:hypothetical protein